MVNLKKPIFMRQCEGSESADGIRYVFCKKSLYGLKQSQWNKKFDSFMSSIGYQSSKHDNFVCLNGELDDNKIVLLLYVDDILIDGKSKDKIKFLMNEFEMKDMKATKRILGIDIVRNRKQGIVFFLSQQRYLENVLSSMYCEA